MYARLWDILGQLLNSLINQSLFTSKQIFNIFSSFDLSRLIPVLLRRFHLRHGWAGDYERIIVRTPTKNTQ